MVTARLGAPAPWLLALTLLLDACGGSGGEVRSCSADADCGPGALCVQSSCVSNRPPAVALQLPASPVTHRVLFVDATATDPDPGDAITGHAWTVTALSAGCDAEAEPGTGPRLEVVFWCAGTYEVTVRADDARGGTSAPARATFEVAASSGFPVVTPAAPSAVDHLCGGAPFACRPTVAGAASSIPLSALVDDPSGGAFTARWRVVPPAGADPATSVSWSRGATSLSTEAWLETPGGPIAGAWRFRLRITSAAGLLGQADQLVEIGNRPPELTSAPLRVDHRFSGGSYLASGALALAATDPDGDPVTLSASLEESAAAGCSSSLGPVTGGSVALELACRDPGALLGAAGRSIRLRAADANGAITEVRVPVEVANRAPVLRLASNPAGGSIVLDHSVGPCIGAAGACFVVAGSARFEASDPDGDPLDAPAVAAAVAATQAASAGEATTAGGAATFRFTTPAALPGEFRRPDGTTGFTLVATATDPFGAVGRLEAPVVALNRPPVLKAPLTSVVVTHRYDATRGVYTATAPLATFEDPDGDPLRPDLSTGDATCASFGISGGEVSVTCERAYAVAPGLPPLASFAGSHAVVATARDGWAEASAPTSVSIQDGAPGATAFDGVVESCFCQCPKWSADGTTCLGPAAWRLDTVIVPLPVLASEADGDPVQVTFTGATPVGGAQKTAMPGACSATLISPTLPITVQVTIDDGLARVQTSSRVAGVRCAKAGNACTP